METTRTATPASSLDEIVSGVVGSHEPYFISQNGKQVAAVVPLYVLESFKRGIQRIGEIMETAASMNAGEDPEEIERCIALAVQDVKDRKRAARDRK